MKHTNKYYHVSLYEDDHAPVYDDRGRPILVNGAPQVREPEYNGKTLVNSVYDYGIRPVNGPSIPIETRTPDDP